MLFQGYLKRRGWGIPMLTSQEYLKRRGWGILILLSQEYLEGRSRGILVLLLSQEYLEGRSWGVSMQEYLERRSWGVLRGVCWRVPGKEAFQRACRPPQVSRGQASRDGPKFLRW